MTERQKRLEDAFVKLLAYPPVWLAFAAGFYGVVAVLIVWSKHHV